MGFTKGKTYSFAQVSDPEGWGTFNDNKHWFVFYRTDILFETEADTPRHDGDKTDKAE